MIKTKKEGKRIKSSDKEKQRQVGEMNEGWLRKEECKSEYKHNYKRRASLMTLSNGRRKGGHEQCGYRYPSPKSFE